MVPEIRVMASRQRRHLPRLLVDLASDAIPVSIEAVGISTRDSHGHTYIRAIQVIHDGQAWVVIWVALPVRDYACCRLDGTGRWGRD